MKKLILTLAFILAFSATSHAESIVVIDDNGYVVRQITTAPTTYTTTYTTSQPLTVVRQSPTITNSYYYDAPTTAQAITAGITTALVGGLIYNGFRHHKFHHHHRPKPAHRPHHGGKHRR